MLQVGSLFSQRARDEEEEQKQITLDKIKAEREKNRKLKRALRERSGNEDMTSSDEDCVDPEQKRTQLFEDNLKKRIFYADRIEKVEKALIDMNFISKDTLFCSDFEFERFK